MRDRGHPTLAPHDRTRLNNRLGVKSVTTPDLRPASPREYQECLSVYREACRFVPNPFEAWRFPREYRGKSAPTASPSRGRLVIS